MATCSRLVLSVVKERDWGQRDLLWFWKQLKKAGTPRECNGRTREAKLGRTAFRHNNPQSRQKGQRLCRAECHRAATADCHRGRDAVVVSEQVTRIGSGALSSVKGSRSDGGDAASEVGGRYARLCRIM